MKKLFMGLLIAGTVLMTGCTSSKEMRAERIKTVRQNFSDKNFLEFKEKYGKAEGIAEKLKVVGKELRWSKSYYSEQQIIEMTATKNALKIKEAGYKNKVKRQLSRSTKWKEGHYVDSLEIELEKDIFTRQ